MKPEDLINAHRKVVGTRQTAKAVESDKAVAVFLAGDADKKVIAPVVSACQEKGIGFYYVDSMAELGKACNIKVGAAMAAILAK